MSTQKEAATFTIEIPESLLTPFAWDARGVRPGGPAGGGDRVVSRGTGLRG